MLFYILHFCSKKKILSWNKTKLLKKFFQCNKSKRKKLFFSSNLAFFFCGGLYKVKVSLQFITCQLIWKKQRKKEKKQLKCCLLFSLSLLKFEKSEKKTVTFVCNTFIQQKDNCMFVEKFYKYFKNDKKTYCLLDD